jgi:REP element-mobilizing transposase RayT
MSEGSGFRGEPLAYFVTFAGYGTRLHGDIRGTVDRRHNTPGEPPLPRDDFRKAFERRNLNWPPVVFGEDARRIVEASFQATCTFHGWALLAVHCRTNHVHAVVVARETPSRVMHALKWRATRALRDGAVMEESRPVWARHGSTRYLWTDEDVSAAIAYTMEAQGTSLPGTGEWKPYE